MTYVTQNNDNERQTTTRLTIDKKRDDVNYDGKGKGSFFLTKLNK